MGDDDTTRCNLVSLGSQSDELEAAEEAASFRSPPDKGKEKYTVSSINRPRSSGDALLGYALSDLAIFGSETGQKGSESSSSVSSYTAHQSSYGSHRPSHDELFTSSGQTSRFANDANAATRAEAQFNTFVRGSGFSDSEHLGHLVAQPPKAAKPLKQRSLDGIEVVELLSRPEGCEPPPRLEYDELKPVEAARLHEALFGSETPRPVWDQLLDFNADFFVRPETSSEECKAYMGTPNVKEARSIWFQQWSDVLSSYTNEVWGDLGTLAKDAEREIEKSEQGNVASNAGLRALERLRLVLAHVRGHRP
ncbi:hypothetical protein E4U17_007375 [Claviceps sp. LM77 group G4]|nr:hypothetical protein E4U17_007375 [Claviceps sp. LM77 group G4]KAG6057567.1 hypothetical protein E4U33_007470 [Claviceps sp. LM78 group G4]KAG6070600.1 hypothetical protein E4U16_006741 [Claviceps sp. LM84 group G4]